jgi:BirA family biotin operon repressor/biotin-[acetyl-CoA-carboxylase] ligase
MTEPREEWQLDTIRLGRRVLVFDRLGSTNTVAAGLTGPDGIVVLADEQTAGRGQHGRTWLAAPRSSALLSLRLMPPEPLRRPALLTAWSAVAVCAIVRELVGVQARIKWPNDVLLRGRKVCGILIEQGHGPEAGATVVGIGLNVQQSEADFLAAGLPQATSLATFSPAPLDTYEVARRLVRQLDADYDLLCQGDLNTLEALWKWHLGLLGRFVVAECADGAQRGRLLEVGFAGLELDRPGRGALVMQPEAVLHLEEDRSFTRAGP